MNELIANMIYIIRGQKVMLDSDLAALYGVKTKRLNEALRRNKERFPEDFAFQLRKEEWEILKTQMNTDNLRSQFATSSYGGRRYLPWAFTEHGVVMLANVLRSKQAIQMSIKVVRAFVQMRNVLAFSKKLSKELQELKSFILKNSHKTDQEFRKVWKAIENLSKPIETKEQRRIGFDLGQ